MARQQTSNMNHDNDVVTIVRRKETPRRKRRGIKPMTPPATPNTPADNENTTPNETFVGYQKEVIKQYQWLVAQTQRSLQHPQSW